MAFCGAIDAVSAVNLLVVSDDTRHIQCMPPLGAAASLSVRYDIRLDLREERVRLKKNYQRTAIFRISKRLYHWHAHTSQVMECPIERLMKYIEYDSSTVIALTQSQIAMKDILEKKKKHTDDKL